MDSNSGFRGLVRVLSMVLLVPALGYAGTPSIRAKGGAPVAPGTSGRAMATCACGCGGTPQPLCAHKDCVCAKTMLRPVVKTSAQPLRVKAGANLGTSRKAGCACGCGGTPQPLCAHKNCVCAKGMLRPVVKPESALNRATSGLNLGTTRKSGCACGCGGTPQPICAHRNCECAKTAARTLVPGGTKILESPAGGRTERGAGGAFR